MFRAALMTLALALIAPTGATGQEGLIPGDDGDKAVPPRPQPEAPMELPPATRTLVTEEDFQSAHEPPAEKETAHADSLIELLGGAASVYMALPSKLDPPMPGMILLSEGRRVDERTRMWADRLADEGYAALALELVDSRAAGDDPASADTTQLQELRAFHALDAAAKALADDPRLRADRIGCIGWSSGGTWAFQYSLSPPAFDALVVYDPAPNADPSLLKEVRFPVLAFFTDADRSFPAAKVNEFEAAMKSAGVPARVVRVGEESSPDDARETAADTWVEVRPFLEKYVKKGA